MSDFPADYRLLFDTVIRTAGHDVTGKMLFRVEVIDLYHDGPNVPSSLGTSPICETAAEAMEWASEAIAAFNRAN